MGQGDPSAEGMIESSTGTEELNDTQPNCVTAGAPNADPDPEGSSAREIPGQTCMVRNRMAQLVWGGVR